MQIIKAMLQILLSVFSNPALIELWGHKLEIR